MLKLPQNPAIKNLFDVAQLADLGANNSWPTYQAVRQASKKLFSDKKVRAVHCICMRANGAIQLLKFGPRGGKKIIWEF